MAGERQTEPHQADTAKLVAEIVTRLRWWHSRNVSCGRAADYLEGTDLAGFSVDAGKARCEACWAPAGEPHNPGCQFDAVLADEARERRAFITGYIAAIRDIQRTGLGRFGEKPDGTMRRAAIEAWETANGR